MRQIPPFELIEHWSPAQTLAAYDYCRLMSDMLWNRYHDVLLEEMVRQDQITEPAQESTGDDNLQLPFEEDPSF